MRSITSAVSLVSLSRQVEVDRWWWWWYWLAGLTLSWSESRAEGKHRCWTSTLHTCCLALYSHVQCFVSTYQPACSDHNVTAFLTKRLWSFCLSTCNRRPLRLRPPGCDGTEIRIDLLVWPGGTQGETSSWLHTAPWVKYHYEPAITLYC